MFDFVLNLDRGFCSNLGKAVVAEHRLLWTGFGDLNKVMYVQNNAYYCWYNHNWRVSAMQCTSECHQGTLFTPGGKTTLCGFAVTDSVKLISQQSATCQQKWQKPRIIKCVKDILVLLRNISVKSLNLFPSSGRSMCPSLEPGQTLWLC